MREERSEPKRRAFPHYYELGEGRISSRALKPRHKFNGVPYGEMSRIEWEAYKTDLQGLYDLLDEEVPDEHAGRLLIHAIQKNSPALRYSPKNKAEVVNAGRMARALDWVTGFPRAKIKVKKNQVRAVKEELGRKWRNKKPSEIDKETVLRILKKIVQPRKKAENDAPSKVNLNV